MRSQIKTGAELRLKAALLAATAMVMATPAFAAEPDALSQGFAQPPAEARPRVWWHWLSGNVSEPGITKDLEWMKRVGLGGMQMFDGDMGAPKVVDHRIAALTPEWLDNLSFAAREAKRLGLEFAMAAAPGWSETGGPWVKPEAGMKKLVWAATPVRGGGTAGRLNAPPNNSGPFQGIPQTGYDGRPTGVNHPFFKSIAVLAFKTPADEVLPSPKVSTNAAGLDVARLVDGDIKIPQLVERPTPERPIIVRYDYDKPQTLRALTYVGPVGGRFGTGPGGRIEASEDDGKTWRTLRTLTGSAHNPSPQRTFAFAATTAKTFRVVFDTPDVSQEPWPRAPGMPIAELAFTGGARVNLFEDKAGFGVMPEDESVRTPSIDPGAVIASDQILDLTDRLGPDGQLNWKAPAGQWTVLWLGYSLTGEVNHPATPEATGLEVDKFSAKDVRAHLDAYMTPVLKAMGSEDRGLKYIVTDSWEAGDENWTQDMLAAFKTRRGYDARRMLPVLAGYVVDSARDSDAFLWDFRRTLADLLAENHYGEITRFAKEHGLGYYGEATGAAWPTVADGIQAKRYTDIPMGEFWAMPFGAEPAAYQGVRSEEFPADIAETASTAHLYGKPLVAAESFTSSLPLWTATPWSLKWVADKYMAMGVNRLVIHTSPHQPDGVTKPGLTLGPFGQAFTRNETWGELAKPWVDYLSRSSFMLQQGKPGTDVLYFYGEGAPSGVPYREAAKPALPEGFSTDYVNAEALLTLAQVQDGQIVFPGGASYRILILPDHLDRMTAPLLRKLTALVDQGAILVGPRPAGSPSLASTDAEAQGLAAALWGQTDGRVITRADRGKGRVYWGPTPQQVLADLGVKPRFDYGKASPDTKLVFARRRLDDGEVFFVSNQTGLPQSVEGRFAITGKAPEIWRADDGSHRPLSYRIEDGVTKAPLELAPYDAVFVVFRRPAAASSATYPKPIVKTLATLNKGWSVKFAADGVLAPAGLGDWTQSPEPATRYFSGIADYRLSIDAAKGWLKPGQRTLLDLGTVNDVAEVRLNGQLVGGAWKVPYRLDVTEYLRSGRNELEVKVANVWRNRMVGDAQPGAKKETFTNASEGGGFSALGAPIGKDTPLLPSGLIGPVILTTETDPNP